MHKEDHPNFIPHTLFIPHFVQVRQRLSSADAIWIVSNIRRAVNDKTARDWMPGSFRQALVDHGRPGALSFLATASDCLVS